MDEVTQDNRFAHIAKDPRFRRMKHTDRKVQIDKRFKGMFSDKQFKVKYTVDKRGRPMKGTSNEDLKSFYELESSDESSESEDEEVKQQPKEKKKEKSKKDKQEATPEKKTKETKEKKNKDKAEKKDKRKAETEVKDITKATVDNHTELKDKKTKDISKKPVKESNDSRFNMELLAQESESEESFGDESEEEPSGEEDDGSESDVATPSGTLDVINGPDYARGEGLVSSDSEEEEDEEEEEESDEESSASDSSSLTDEEDLEHQWGEVHRQDIVDVQEATPRLALCNMDWDRIKATDILMVLNSYKPTSGIIKSVKIYPSEYGLQRMKEENEKGPQELLQATAKLRRKKKIDENGEGEEGSSYHREKLRVYQMNRLRYYYAVVECDSVATADAIYKECDGMEYESSGTHVDLRFIPDEMSFDDQTPKSEATDVLDVNMYKPTLFENAAMQLSKVDLTWDETDPDRLQLTMQKFDKAEMEDMDLKAYLASDSDTDNDGVDPYAGYEDPDFGPVEPLDDDQLIKELKDLVDAKTEEQEEKENDIDMQITWEPSLVDKVNKAKEKESEQDMTVWDKYLKKAELKKKAKREAYKKKKKGLKEESEEEEEEEEEDSEEDIPEGVDLNDPFFKEEIDRMDAEMKGDKKAKKKSKETAGKKKKKGKEENLTPEEEEEKRKKEAELALIMMDEDDQKQHFSLRAIQEREEEESGGGNKKKKKRKLKLKKLKQLKEDAAATIAMQDTFELNTADPRFKDLYENPNYNIDPSSSEFKKTKGAEKLIEEKLRRRQNIATDTQNGDTKTPVKRKKGTGEEGNNISASKKPRKETEQTEKKRDVNLDILVKSVKAKANMLETQKKKKKKNKLPKQVI